MGGKISKRGSYNLKKREKESKKYKLDGRTTSIVNLTLSQIYEDELKSPKPDNFGRNKDKDHIYQNQSSIKENKPTLNTIQNINDRDESDRDDYSNPDDERIYENIIEESNSNFEEQVEKKKRKSWNQSEAYDGDKYVGLHNSISEENEEHGYKENWKEILNGEFWKDKNEQVEVKEVKAEEQIEVVVNNQKYDDSDMEQLEVKEDRFISHEKEEQISITDINRDLEISYKEEQIEVESQSHNYEQIEVKEEQVNLHEYEDNFSKQIEMEDKSGKLEKIESVLDDEDTKLKNVENKIEQIAELDNSLQNQQMNKTHEPDEETTNNSYLEKQENITEKTENPKLLSKTMSSNSEAFYEIANEGWMEDYDYDEFYDAEDFNNGAQIEVVDELPIKKVSNENELKENANEVDEENINFKTQTKLENKDEPLVDVNFTKIDESHVNEEKDFGLLIDFSSDTTSLNIEEGGHDEFTAVNKTNLSEISRNIENQDELNYNKDESLTLLIDLNQNSEPIESLNQISKNTNPSLLILESTSLESFRNDNDINEELPHINQQTEIVDTSKELEKNDINPEVEKLSSLVELSIIKDTNIIEKPEDKPLDNSDIRVENVAEDKNESHNLDYLTLLEERPKIENLQSEYNKNETNTIAKPENLPIFANNKNQNNDIQEPLSAVTPEDIAKNQMKAWEKQEDEEDEEAILQINAIINNISQVAHQIDNLGPTETDNNVHNEIYQTLIKLMRDINYINNYNFNEKVIQLQNRALSEVHNCLRNLQTKNI